MNKPAIVLSSPAHPAMAEMLAALESDIDYKVIGPRLRDGSGITALTNPAVKIAYRLAVEARRYTPGTIAYQWARSRTLLRHLPQDVLVHCCSHMAYGGLPWIGDYENVNVLPFYSPRLLHSSSFINHLRRKFSDPACRAVRVWSDSAAHSFRALFPEPEIRAKLHVVYPSIAIPAQASLPKEINAVPRILFVARGFWVKGGPLLLDALRRLRSQFAFHVNFICDLPPEYEACRSEFDGFVDFHTPTFSRSELFSRFYSRADIFVMLGMADSYGVALLEASAFGLPVVAMRLDSGLSDLLRLSGNAIQVEPAHQIFDKDGLHCIEPDALLRRLQLDSQPRVVDQIAEALASLLGNPVRRQAMGASGRAAVSEGPLSTATMRHAMLDLYRRATHQHE